MEINTSRNKKIIGHSRVPPNLDPDLSCACRGEKSTHTLRAHSETRQHWGQDSEFPQASVSKRGAKCEAIAVKMIIYSHANTPHLLKKGFALSLVLKVRVFWNSEMAWPQLFKSG